MMIDDSDVTATSIDTGGRPARHVVASLAALMLLGGAAHAAEVGYPKDGPKVILDVPDGWAVAMTATGLELRSPEKNSIIVAQVVNRKRALVEAWTKEAAEKLKAFGVSFDQNVNFTGKSGAGAGPKPKVPTIATSGDTASATPEGAFTFSGTPSLQTPGTTGSNNPVDPGQFSVQALTGFDGKVKKAPKLHFKTVEYVGTTMNGKPVDAELAIYTLSDERVFLFMQESEPTDNRSVAIAQSIRGTKDSAK